LILLAALLVISLAVRIYQSRFNRILLFYVVALLMVALSCIKITYGFSSRYAAQAIPLMIPLAAFFYQAGKTSCLRAAAGVVLGLLSLYSFLFQEALKP